MEQQIDSEEMCRGSAEYDITCEATLGGACSKAQGSSLSTHPYLVMASDPGPLFAALDASAGPP